MSLVDDVRTGAVAGLAATAPMTLAMIELHDHLPVLQQHPLPPRQIVKNLTKKIGVHQKLDKRERFLTTMLAHFSVGTTAGAVYGPLSRQMPLHPALSGALFGLGVWAANYLGVLPSLGLLKPATRQAPERNGLMIAAHLVWGAATGVLVDRLRHEQEQRRQRRLAGVSAAAQWNDHGQHMSPLPQHSSDAASFCGTESCELEPSAQRLDQLPDEIKPPV